jgi:hypothetical protein
VVNAQVDPTWLWLHYTLPATQERVDYAVGLTTTRQRFGGLLWWFLCPLASQGGACGRRVGKLYLPPRGRYFGCRQCHGLTYTSCQESHKFDGLRRRTGVDFARWSKAASRRARRGGCGGAVPTQG